MQRENEAPSRSAVAVGAEKVKSSVSAGWRDEGLPVRKISPKNHALEKSRRQPVNTASLSEKRPLKRRQCARLCLLVLSCTIISRPPRGVSR